MKQLHTSVVPRIAAEWNKVAHYLLLYSIRGMDQYRSRIGSQGLEHFVVCTQTDQRVN